MALFLAGFLAGASAADPHAGAAEVAVMLDLSGSQAGIGRPAMNGFVLGLQQAAASGPMPFAALVDTRSDPDQARIVAGELVSRVVIGAGFTDSDAVLTTGPVFDRARVPFLTVGATDPALPSKAGSRVFLVPFGDNTQAAAAAEFSVSAFGGTAVVLWDSTSDYTRTLPRYFRTRFEQLGGDVLLDASFDGGCDLGALGGDVAGLPAAPDFLYLAGLPDCIGEVVASLRAAGVDVPIVGGDGFDTAAVLTGGGGATDGVWFTTHAWLDEDTGTPRVQQFIADYREAYGVEPSDAFAALGYDGARLILDALGRAGKGKAKDLQSALEQTDGFEGVTGTIRFTADDHVPLKTVWILRVASGELELATSLVPEVVPPPIVD